MICRICRKQFLGQEHPVGQSSCPECRQRVTGSLPGNQFPTDNTITDRLPIRVNVELAESARLGDVYARNAGLDPNEAFEPQVEGGSFATWLLQEWKATLPAVPSAYQTSGVLPTSALLVMTLGAGIGMVLAAAGRACRWGHCARGNHPAPRPRDPRSLPLGGHRRRPVHADCWGHAVRCWRLGLGPDDDLVRPLGQKP